MTGNPVTLGFLADSISYVVTFGFGDFGSTPAVPSVGSVTLSAAAVTSTLSAAALGTVTLEADH
jgi:hypothetical protein